MAAPVLVGSCYADVATSSVVPGAGQGMLSWVSHHVALVAHSLGIVHPVRVTTHWL